MTDPIMMTPAELWQIFLAICGAILTMSSVAAVITNIIHKAKEPNKKQDERLTALEDNMKKIEARLELGNKRFADDADKMLSLERSMKNTNKIIIESLQALTAHAIDGNNIEQLKQSERALNDYLIEKI